MRYYVDPKFLPVLAPNRIKRAVSLFRRHDTATIAHWMGVRECAVANTLHRLREQRHAERQRGSACSA